jgi:hypothetical protein
MADLKISDMAYRAVQESDMIPVVDSSNLTTNYYALAGMINFQRIFRWNSSAIYLADDLVIYNSETVKGMFLVTSTTLAGDSPEGAGFNKFKSVSLSWVRNDTASLSNASPNVDIGYLRTKEITITQTASTTVSYNINSNLYTHVMGTKVNVYTFNDRQSIVVNYIDIQNGFIVINITVGSSNTQAMRVMVQIDG